MVIGNPPYIDSETMTKTMPNLRDIYSQNYKFAKGNWDIYILFFELAFNNINNYGVFAYITPNKWLSIKYGQKLRESLLTNIMMICNCNYIKVFEARNEPIIIIISKKNNN